MQPWNIKQMKQLFIEKYLPECQTATERDCCTVYFRRELRDFVAEMDRKPTPAECAILDEYGIAH